MLTYDATADELMAGLKALEGGPTYMSSRIVRLVTGTAASESATLTAREQEVLSLVVKGYTNNEIASELYVSPHTVRSHLQSVSSRLGVSSRGRLAARARELGLA
ncbi:MAG: response regulator transcription factor [Dehalococcoidia bacterium]